MSPRARVAERPPRVALPAPRLSVGKSLPESLRRRRTIREISDKKLSLQLLSNLLWAACGVNRPKGPFGTLGVTAASASNSQEIDLFVALADGTYLFDARHHRLVPAVASDLRGMAIGPGQKNVTMKAPVQLLYVVDIEKLIHTSGFQEPGLKDIEVQKSYYYVDTGLIAGNVYLFAASQGLAAWFHNCDRAGLARKLGLRREQRVLFGQSIGYPRDSSLLRPRPLTAQRGSVSSPPTARRRDP
jgi:nitroreductase